MLKANEYSQKISKKVQAITDAVDKLQKQVMKDRDNNGFKGIYEIDWENTDADKNLEQIMLDIAWIKDRILRNPYLTEKGYNKTWRYKIRKALGYTYP